MSVESFKQKLKVFAGEKTENSSFHSILNHPKPHNLNKTPDFSH
jgi:hypothetical protein